MTFVPVTKADGYFDNYKIQIKKITKTEENSLNENSKFENDLFLIILVLRFFNLLVHVESL